MTDCTIDTTIVGKSAQGNFDCLEILNRITRTRKIVFDNENIILDEYTDCIERAKRSKKPGWEMMQGWITTLRNSNKMRTVYPNFSQNEEVELEKLRFDRTDWIFVKSCKASLNKELIAIESDYTPEIKDFLLKKHSIKVIHIDECIQNNLYQ
ncbi:hypothetical protein [Methanospirillum sp.]